MDRRSRIDSAVSITYDNSFIIIIEIIYFLENLNQIREIFTKIFINVTQSHIGLCFFIACSFLSFCEFVVPLITTKAELCRRRLGAATWTDSGLLAEVVVFTFTLRAEVLLPAIRLGHVFRAPLNLAIGPLIAGCRKQETVPEYRCARHWRTCTVNRFAPRPIRS